MKCREDTGKGLGVGIRILWKGTGEGFWFDADLGFRWELGGRLDEDENYVERNGERVLV